LLELSLKNALSSLNDRIKKEVEEKSKGNSLLENLKNDLRLPKLPVLIECFDNSNLQGTNPVAACVVFKYGRPSKSEYRHYNIKSVKGPNDFRSMEEIVFRRYKRLIDEKKKLPDLIIVDGGTGQLNAAISSLEKLKIFKEVSVIGIAKRLEEIYCSNDPVPIYINKNSQSLKLIQNIRNEAHRFGINFHKLKRSQEMKSSILDEIENIGEKTKNKLLRKFHTVENIKNAESIELIDSVGKYKAEKIKRFFSSHEN